MCALVGRDEFGVSLPVSEERAGEWDLRGELQDLECQLRRCEAEMIEVLDRADRAGVFALDGHRGLRGWAGASVRWSEAELRDRCRTVRLVRDVPEVLDELRYGRIGVGQVREIARLRANPRCGDRVVEAAAMLIEFAEQLPFVEFRVVARRWESLNDEDGAHRSHEAAHAGRRVATAQLDHTFHLVAQFGAVQGAAIAEVLEAFERAEFDAEWDELRSRLGDEATPSMLTRTAVQRRADAVHAIFMAAASAPVGAQRPEPVVNIVVDLQTFEEHIAALVEDRPPRAPAPGDFARRCETDTGVQVDPFAAVAAAVVGFVRRVVMDSAGVVIDMGRRQRLFRGSARVAALLQGRRCSWPGCGRTRRIQVDHVADWQHRGPTSPWNAGPECEPHNLFKTRGYRVHRDEHGHWHHYRPDGTEITPI